MLFAWQLWNMRWRQREACFAAFRNNNWVGGVIWVGLVAAIVVLATAAGMTLDLELVGIFVLGGAGLALLVGTVATQARRQR